MHRLAERRTHTCIRPGTTSLFAPLDVATGAVVGKGYRRPRATAFLDVLKGRGRNLREGPHVHLSMDNDAPHKTAKVKAWRARRPYWHVHDTPISARGLNRIERWFTGLTHTQPNRGVHPTVAGLDTDIMAFIEAQGDTPKPFR